MSPSIVLPSDEVWAKLDALEHPRQAQEFFADMLSMTARMTLNETREFEYISRASPDLVVRAETEEKQLEVNDILQIKRELQALKDHQSQLENERQSQLAAKEASAITARLKMTSQRKVSLLLSRANFM